MKRKFLAMLGALSLAAVLACGIGVPVPALAQTPSGANRPEGATTPDPATALKLGPCRSGWWLDRGVWACQPPPRSQADCASGETFSRMVTGMPACVGGGSMRDMIHTGSPTTYKCQHDSDCVVSHVCESDGYCAIPRLTDRQLRGY